MRGVYSMSALARLEELAPEYGVDFRDSFLSGIGSSAGAMNLAHYGAGHGVEGISVYTDHLTDGNFMPRLKPSSPLAMGIDLVRLARRRGRPANVDFLVDEVLQMEGGLTQLGGRMTYNAVLTDAETAEARTVPMSRDGLPDPEIYEIFRATGALPVLYNKIVEVHGGRYVDGGATSSIPLDPAAELDPTPRHIVAILTHEHGNRRPPRGMLYRMGVQLFGTGQSDAVKELIVGPGDEKCNQDLDRLESENGVDPQTGISFTLVQPSDPERLVGRTTTDKSRVADCAEMGRRDMEKVLQEALVPASAPSLI